MKFYLQENAHDQENMQRLAASAEKAGISVAWHKYRPFSGGDLTLDCPGEPSLYFGSINAVREAGKHQLYPGTFMNMNQLKCSVYYAHYSKYLLNHTYAIYPFGHMPSGWWLYKHFGNEERVFIRPDTNDKVFDGETVSSYNYDRWRCNLALSGVHISQLVVVAKPQKILEECRVFVGYNGVMASSIYRRDGELCSCLPDDSSYNDFAEHVFNHCDFGGPALVMDIAKTEYGYALIELGSVNCAGLYACDTDGLAAGLKSLCESEYECLYGDYSR